MPYDRADGFLYTQPSNPRAYRLTVPQNVGPYVQLVFAEMRRQGRTYDSIEVASGILRSTIKAWKKKNKPGLESVQAVLNTLGWQLTPTPLPEVLPAELSNVLLAFAKRAQLDMPEVWAALIDLAVAQRTSRPH